jgi:hypothetical protein
MTGVEKCLAETESQIQLLEQRLEEAKERERLIIEYPDLNGPVNPNLQGERIRVFLMASSHADIHEVFIKVRTEH